MSDTTEAAARRLREASPVVDGVCRQLERQVEPDEAPTVVEFTELFFSKAPPDFLNERSTDALARMALGAFRFLEGSRPERVDAEVFNPDVDNEGWYAPVTVIRTNISERPFIVDSIRGFLHSRDLSIEHFIYPVLHVERDEEFRIRDIRPSREGESKESLIHCEVGRVTDEETLRELEREVTDRLQDVVRATQDFHPMVDAVNEVVAELAERAQDMPDRKEELEEIQAFLRWLRDGGFVFLGYRGYDLVELPDTGEKAILVEPASGLGILRNEADSAYASPVPLSSLDESLRNLVESGPPLIISKTNAASTVHRLARMDYIGVKKIAPDGSVKGEHRFVGLFTSRAYAEEADKIPILREKLARILDEAGVQEGSHDYKEINTIFNSMAKEELFLTSAGEIGEDIRTVLNLYHTDEVRVTLREDPLQRGVSIMVILPKDRFSGEIRKRIEEALVERFSGEVLNYHLALGEGDQARLHFYVGAAAEKLKEVTSAELEQIVRELIRSWADRVREGLERVRPPDEARRLAARYGEDFSPEYRAATKPSTAVKDILELEAMAAGERTVSIAFATPEESPAVAGGEGVTELNLYLRGERLVLSDFMPILENAGLRVIAVNPFELGRDEVPEAIIYSFVVQDSNRDPLDVEARGSLLAEAILAVRDGDATNDALNALVYTANLSWREVDVLRAYAGYAFQLGAVPSRLSLPTALNKNPEIAKILFELFRARFDPGGPVEMEDRRARADAVRARLIQAMSGVSLLAEDRALRSLATLIRATVRTNYYRYGGESPTRRSGGVPYVAFKVACSELTGLVKTRLLYEVWVRSSRMEGVHLRGAKVARGGIRYSDRPDDFRTEVLGLVKTQMVKNAVIVPAGSKGGFVTLRDLGEREAMAEEAREQYKTLMRGLLDLTDDLEDGEAVPPDGVVCWDEPDPYLVVAADKGTATYSDVANQVSGEYDFWLGDAFASGGSQGYDHKEVAITARGAWECVKRHFREMGKDIQSEPFTVVGIGDMSGDVFGNGMLLSRETRLVAAFDHRHVFIDPDPDPAASFQERKRLFDLGRSSWDDYDRSVLSQGGAIIPRGAKEVELDARARAALGIGEDQEIPDGEALVRAVLKAPVELLWNGGIGTYVKASYETHADVGDASNDAVRVDAPDLRAKVVGEGGNLGLTQEARIEYALAGGRLNTDALDNSGGVDMSDREVNLKILLNHAVGSGEMSVEERNDLLRELTEAVTDLVLADNRSQSLAVSLDEIRALDSLDDLRELMSALERAGLLDRSDEHLPTMEALMERMEEGHALTRPELCVLLAYSKLHLMGHLLRSGVPDDPATESYALGYFPPAALLEAGEESLERHRLKREIVASQLTNDLVDLMGSGFVLRVSRDTGRGPAEVARAWLIAARLAGHRSLLESLREREGQLPAQVLHRWLLGLERVLERTSRWVLANVGADASTPSVIRESLDGLAVLRRHFDEVVEGDDRRLFEERVREIREVADDEQFARNLITLRFLDQLLEILRVGKETGADPLDAARAFYRVSELLQVPWIRQAIYDSAGDDRWEQRNAQVLVEDLTRAHHLLASAAVRRGRDLDGVDRAADELLRSQAREVERLRGILDEIRSEPEYTLPGLSVVVREVKILGERAAAG